MWVGDLVAHEVEDGICGAVLETPRFSGNLSPENFKALRSDAHGLVSMVSVEAGFHR